MSPKTLTWLILFATLLAGAFRLRFLGRDSDELALEQATYENVRTLIHTRYVKELSPEDRQKIFYGALKGMTSSLDDHSRFLPPEVYGQLSEQTRGRFAGIGIEIVDEPRKHTILTPLLDSPAWRAGILPGDRILKIDGESIEALSSEERELRIKGAPDTPLQLTIERDGVEKPFELSLRRAVILIKSIQAEEILGEKLVGTNGPKIGYVQIGKFQQDTSEDLDAAMKRLEGKGMDALILDLRMNGGGPLDEAIQVANLFLKDGPIVTLYYRNAGQAGNSKTEMVTPGKTHRDYPVAILVDSQSASAAEIVAGALRDRGRAVLVGDKTYGKFSVQDVIPLPLGERKLAMSSDHAGQTFTTRQDKIGALKLTIAKYKTPKSDCIDGQGLVPEFLVPSTPDQQKALYASRTRRHLRNNDPRIKEGAPVKSDDDPFDDVQLKKAVEVVREKLSAGK